MYKLIIQDDEGKTTVVPLIRDEITIGRKEGNTIRLTERNVSRRHARIVKSNGSVVVEDLESYNGVKVNGTRIQGRVPVSESDRIQIGDYLLELKMDRGTGDALPPTSPPGVPIGGGAPPAAASPPSMPPMPAPSNGNGAYAQRPPPPRQTQPMSALAPSHPSQPPAIPAEAPATEPGLTQPGRLVVVSSNFAGREFVLDRPTMVIGRTDDNDVVVNHRSISRHHAKVVLEQGRYCIVDMQSSNGVRVNGEDYGKVELRRGDMIDLGHVRMRYVDPGEDFVFERDAQLVEVATRSRGRGALWAGLSVILVGAVVAVVFVTQRTPSASGPTEEPAATGPVAAATPTEPAAAPTTNPPPATEPKPAPEPKPVPAATTTAPTPAAAAPDSGTAAAVVSPPAAPSADTQLEDARRALADEKWLAALAAAEQLLKAAPDNDEAKKIQEKAKAEYSAAQLYEKLVAARDAGKTPDVARYAREIPQASVYRERAEADLAKLHDQYVHDREVEAKLYAARGQCDRISLLARRAGDVYPDARATVEKAGQNCTPVAVAAKPEAPVSTEPDTLSEAQVTALLADAKEAARNNNWTEARKKAEDVLRVRPSDQDALSVGGIAACNLADKEHAVKYIERLKGHRQNMMKQICAAKGVLIE